MMKDIDCHDDAMRTVEINGKWAISLYDTNRVDRYGKAGIRVTIHEGESLVYDTGAAPGGLVYVPHSQSIDGDKALLSAITLCCYDAEHDRNDEPRESGWDSEGLSEIACLLEEEPDTACS